VDIANVRLQFPGGCVANITASRVSTDRVRKLRLFQPHQYISVDYSRQDVAVFSVGANHQISFEQLPVTQGEPLALQLKSFLDCVAARKTPKPGGPEARRSLEVALAILAKIEEHSRSVAQALGSDGSPSTNPRRKPRRSSSFAFLGTGQDRSREQRAGALSIGAHIAAICLLLLMPHETFHPKPAGAACHRADRST